MTKETYDESKLTAEIAALKTEADTLRAKVEAIYGPPPPPLPQQILNLLAVRAVYKMDIRELTAKIDAFREDDRDAG